MASSPPSREEFPHYVEFRQVSKTFDRPVLVECSFHVDAGETVAIIGRSGVGKSVTLSHIMGFLKPDSGRVIVAHQDITEMPEAQLRQVRKKVTMVFQNGALFDSLTVAENILFSLELRDKYDEANKEEVVDGLLEMVDLAEDRDAFPADLSTGYKRAVAIARALAAEPQCTRKLTGPRWSRQAPSPCDLNGKQSAGMSRKVRPGLVFCGEGRVETCLAL